MQRVRAQLHTCRHRIHVVQRRLRHRGALVALMTLLVLGFVEPLACILQRDLFLPAVAAPRSTHHHDAALVGASAVAAPGCTIGTTLDACINAQKQLLQRALPATSVEPIRQSDGAFAERHLPVPVDCSWCSPPSTPLSATPASSHEMVLVLSLLFCVVCVRLYTHVVATLRFPQCSEPPPLRPPLFLLPA